jgi:hypothetical protein
MHAERGECVCDVPMSIHLHTQARSRGLLFKTRAQMIDECQSTLSCTNINMHIIHTALSAVSLCRRSVDVLFVFRQTMRAALYIALFY